MNDAEAVELLQALVEIPSPSGAEGELAAFLVEVLSDLGFAARLDGAGNVVGAVGDRGPRGVLLGHMDTVPGRIPVRLEDGRLHGRGSVDAKGPLAAFVAAASRVHAAGRLGCRLEVVACVEEETPSSRGARHAAAQRSGDWRAVGRCTPDFCIVGEPSGWEAITLGYKGFLRARLVLEQDGSHTAGPQETVCGRAVRAWERVRAGAEELNAGRGRLFQQLHCALAGMHSGRHGVRDRAELKLDMRLPPELPPRQAERWLRGLAPEARLEVEGGIPAWSGSRTTPLHRLVFRAIRRQGGGGHSLLKTGTADLNIVAPAWGCPALAYGPGDASLDHSPGEHIAVTDYLKAVRVLEEVLDGAGEALLPQGAAGTDGRQPAR